MLQAPRKMPGENSLGIAATWVRFPSYASLNFPLCDELVLETYYKVALQKHVVFVPDFQYLHNRLGMTNERDLPAITPRLVIAF